ncbi:MAG: FtsQ-type POTRA domain-containing protein [Rhodospirillales bacterium]|nr:FtsQ-type POTRA domain-containing protein [Rhodospirillales bacterium]MDE0379899.1 FtsQ-type POTRA domain-containing protein [Rhodospirillales bacterium]
MRQLSLFGTRKEEARPAPRRSVSRLASRRLLKWAAITLAGGGIIAGAIWVIQPGTLKGIADEIGAGFVAATVNAGMTVQRIHTEGQGRTPPKAVHAAVGVELGTPIFDVDLDAARERVQAIGWVESATVERHLPSTLHVRIVERTPVALWQRNQRLVMVDRAGAEIAGETLDQYTHLPVIVGDGALRHMPTLLDAMASDPALSGRVEAAIWIGGRRWTIHFDNGLEAKLPESDIGSAWARLVREVGDHSLLDGPIAVVDLRLPDRTILRARPPELPADDRT